MRKLFLLTLAAAGLLGSGPVNAETLDAGYDCWKTESGTQFQLPDTLPSGHFGTKNGVPSDPIPAGTVVIVTGDPLPNSTVTTYCTYPVVTTVAFDPHGTPVEPNSQHAVSQSTTVTKPVDTIVSRNTNADFPTTGSTDVVQTEIIALSLRSAAPLWVQYGAEGPEPYNVKITLDGVQPVGQATLTANTLVPLSGGVVSNALNVNYKIEFSHASRPVPAPIPGQSITFTNTQGSFLSGMAPVPSTTAAERAVVVTGLMGLGVVALLLRRRRNSIPA